MNATLQQLDVKILPDHALRMKCEDVTEFDEGLHNLLQVMGLVMARHRGIGLAAPQIGLARRICVIDAQDGEGLRELVNPRIHDLRGEGRLREGCLSIPGVHDSVKRATQILWNAQDRHGDPSYPYPQFANGLLAQAIQHECDHLDGVLFTDRLDRVSRKLALSKHAKIQRMVADRARLARQNELLSQGTPGAFGIRGHR